MCVCGGGLIFAPCTYKQTKLVFLLRNREVKEEGRGGGREEVEQERGGGGERWRRRRREVRWRRKWLASHLRIQVIQGELLCGESQVALLRKTQC